LTFLLDTNVISGLRKPSRDPRLDGWVRQKPPEVLHISVITVGEIEKGIEQQRAADPAYAARLADWRDSLIARFGVRILPIDLEAARRWGPLAHRRRDDEIDMLIAATALEHGLTLVTRNVSDFRDIPGLRVENPFA
jgi:predicted nucleic acid-binding protein